MLIIKDWLLKDIVKININNNMVNFYLDSVKSPWPRLVFPISAC